MQVINMLEKFLNILDPNTLLFITSDHGHRKSLKNQIKDLTFQMITLMKCIGRYRSSFMLILILKKKIQII